MSLIVLDKKCSIPKNKDTIRLKSIKLKLITSPTECCCCQNIFSFTKMYRVYRWGINKSANPFFYCTNCMHSKEEVLHEVDTDEISDGIAYVDPFWGFEKKDRTRLLAVIERMRPKH